MKTEQSQYIVIENDRQLEQEATAILRAAQCAEDGRDLQEVSRSQRAFERRIRPAGFGGYSRKKR